MTTFVEIQAEEDEQVYWEFQIWYWNVFYEDEKKVK